jgi:hypothetical protein
LPAPQGVRHSDAMPSHASLGTSSPGLRRAKRIAWFASAAALACTRNLDLPSPKPPTIPFVSITSIAPQEVRANGVVSIAFSGSTASTTCSASVGGQLANCTFTPPSSCGCTFTAGSSVPEGTLLVTATMGNAVGNGLAIGVVVVDRTLPAVDEAPVSIVRRPCGADDAISAAPGAVVDEGVPYATRGIAAVRVWAGPSGGVPLLSLAPAGDGSFAQVDIPGTGGAISPAPPVYYLSAVDVAGNESARAAVFSGALTAAPPIDPLRAVVVDRSGADGLLGEAGALGAVETLCAAQPVAAGGTPLGAPFSPSADGSFAQVTLTGGGPGTVYLRSWDKAGNVAGPTKVRSVDAEMRPGDRLAYAPGVGTALFARAADAVPSAPGLGALHAGEIPDARLADVATTDAASYLVTAASELSTVAASWTSTELQPVSSGYAAYDPGRLRTVLVAGNGTFENDGTSWTYRGALPFGNLRPIAYHAASGGVVSIDAGPWGTGEMKRWNGTGWTPVTVAGPHPVGSGVMATDASLRDKVVYYEDGSAFTWEFDATSWTTIASAPNPRVSQPIVAFDAARNQVVLYGGYASPTSPTKTWRWTGTQWLEIVTANNPGTCWTGAAAYQPGPPGRLVLLGGSPGGAGTCSASAAGWQLDATNWTAIASGVSPPVGFAERAAAYDAARKQVVVVDRETWLYGTSWQEQVPRLPPSIAAARLVHDPRRSAMTYVDAGRQTWTVGAGGWTRTAVGAPPAVQDVLYDPERGGLVAFELRGSAYHAWRLSGASWVEDPSGVAGLPSGEALQFVVDPVRGRIVATGVETYEYDGSSWTHVAPTNFFDANTVAGPVLFFDAASGKVFASGGWWDDPEYTSGSYPNVWAWNGQAWSLVVSDNGYNGLDEWTFDANVGRTISVEGSTNVLFDPLDATGPRWKSNAVTGTVPGAAMAFDPLRGVTVGLSDREARELRSRQPHARYATMEALFRLPAGSLLGSATATFAGAAGGASGSGVELRAWNWTSWTWTSLGSNAAASPTDAARTISADLSPANHVRDGRIWLLAVPTYPSGAGAQSQLWIDAVELSARYTLPP